MVALLHSLQAHTGIILTPAANQRYSSRTTHVEYSANPFTIDDLLEVRSLTKGLHHLDMVQEFLVTTRQYMDQLISAEHPEEDRNPASLALQLQQEQVFQAFLKGL